MCKNTFTKSTLLIHLITTPSRTAISLSTYESAKTLPTFLKLQQMEMSRSLQRYTLQLKKQAPGWLFSEQTNRTLGVCWSGIGRWVIEQKGSRRHPCAKLFWKIKAMKLDSRKDCFDKLRLKHRCCYPWLFLGTETESLPQSQTGSARGWRFP